MRGAGPASRSPYAGQWHGASDSRGKRRNAALLSPDRESAHPTAWVDGEQNGPCHFGALGRRATPWGSETSDPFNTSNQTTSLSDAVEFSVGP